MKKVILIPLFYLFNVLYIYSQVNVCETQKENTIDPNTISVKKCEIEEKEDYTKKITRTRIIRKRPLKKIANKQESSQLKVEGNNIDLGIQNNKTVLKLPNATKEVLFNLVEEIPMFNSCKNSTREDNVKCFKEKINTHFSKKFSTYEFLDESIKDKVFIQFSIDIYGKVIKPRIKSKKHNKLLNKELIRILNKLPNFTPGKVQGIPVVVTYSFPLNLTLN
ncbi:energy transducer TonB [Tenacibaculum aiptasiae]|uniref:energy transducer TonB n=1 Tax=Tenacibaculum aiptasiae TaxID=426481 RepID=UPI00232F102E|nr:energy transducer TonB [Tenacibaculum aiptasiae]